MKRLKVDTAAPAVKKFLRSLTIDANGVEVELGGQVFCKIVPPGQLSDAEKTARLADVRSMLRRSRARSKSVATRVIERDIRAALATVREKR
jgi:hypothetical protein